MSAIDGILALLEDGRWHDLRETVKKSRLHKFKVEMILSFLAEYNFIDLDKEQKKARLTPTMFRFLREVRRLEKEKRVT